jgi:hypothetical protein
MNGQVTGTVNGDALDAAVSATLGVGTGAVSGSYTEKPASFSEPIGSLLVDHMITCTLNNPAGAPADQTLLAVTGGNYDVVRTYHFEGGEELQTVATATLAGSAMTVVGSMNGVLPTLAAGILSVTATLLPNGPDSVLDSGTIVLADGTVISWSGEHTFSTGLSLLEAYDVATVYSAITSSDTEFSYSFTSQVVAEPSSLALLASLALGLAAARPRG